MFGYRPQRQPNSFPHGIPASIPLIAFTFPLVCCIYGTTLKQGGVGTLWVLLNLLTIDATPKRKGIDIGDGTANPADNLRCPEGQSCYFFLAVFMR